MPELNAPRVLVVDDEPDLRTLVAMTLAEVGAHCVEADTLAQARALLAGGAFQFCLCDLRLPDGSGVELLEHIQARYPALPVAMITAHATVETAIAALKGGAFDFVLKPIAPTALRSLARSAFALAQAPRQGAALLPLIGSSAAMAALRSTVQRVARTQAPVLVTGESGTGKELVARLLHAQSPRTGRPFVPINCGAIPEALLESELFGHRRGAFTGAHADHDGLFQNASGGTLFLDEIAELPLSMQVKLLRALQERCVRPVGAAQEIAVDVRIVAATHQDLAAAVRAGRFRQDLYYRINVIGVHVPPLRERRDDIIALAEHLLTRTWAGGAPPQIAPDALAALQNYAFPGNVRELENILERAAALCEDARIRPADLQLPEWMSPPAAWPSASLNAPDTAARSDTSETEDHEGPTFLNEHLASEERARIVAALEATRWNRTAAAARLGLTLRALRYRMQKLGVE